MPVGQPTLYAHVAFTKVMHICQYSNFWLYSIISTDFVDNDHLPLFLVAAKRASRMATVGQSIAQKVPLPRALQMRPGNFVYSNRITKTYSSILYIP